MEMENYYMILGISYFNIFCIVVIILFFFIFWRLHVWYNKKHNVPKVFNGFLENGVKEKCQSIYHN